MGTEVVLGGATGSDRVGMHNRKWRHRMRPQETGSHGSDRVRMRVFSHVFFLTRVVQNVGTRDRRSRDPEPSCACMRNRKLGFPYFSKFYSATSLQQLFTYIHIDRHMMAIKND